MGNDQSKKTVAMSSAGILTASTITTTPHEGQKPGTSGLRKKTKVFAENENYLENFVASTLMAVSTGTGTEAVDFAATGKSLLIGGDGRYFNDVAIQRIVKIAVGFGVTRVWIGENGLLSTPAVSSIIRERGPRWQSPFGAFILTASHNPGGPEEDFGIKVSKVVSSTTLPFSYFGFLKKLFPVQYNCANGGPAPEGLTDAIFENTKTIASYPMAKEFPEIDLTKVGTTVVEDGGKSVTVEVISSSEVYVSLLKTAYDFDAIKALLDRKDFSMVYDSMHGVNGPYAKAIFCDELGQSESVLMNAVPKDDFGGHHAGESFSKEYSEEHILLCIN